MCPRLVIVEDEPIVALDLRRQMEDLGMDVVGVHASIEAALPACASAPPDVVLMDIRLLGETDGLTGAEELYVCGGVPVILVSAYGDPETLARACRAGAYAFVPKPCSAITLRAAVALTLAKHAELRRVTRAVEPMRAALDAVGVAVVVTDGSRRVCYLNAAAAELLELRTALATELDLGELLDGLEPWASYAALGDLPPAAARAGAAVRAGHPLALTVRRAAGTSTPLWVWTITAEAR